MPVNHFKQTQHNLRADNLLLCQRCCSKSKNEMPKKSRLLEFLFFFFFCSIKGWKEIINRFTLIHWSLHFQVKANKWLYKRECKIVVATSAWGFFELLFCTYIKWKHTDKTVLGEMIFIFYKPNGILLSICWFFHNFVGKILDKM